MAETLLSPGVLARETDQSFIQGQPVQAGAAVIGPAAKGPVGIPTLVTSYSEYQAIFGSDVTSGSQQYEYLTQTSANNYFSQGGTSLLVTRVQSGSFTGATSTAVSNSLDNTAFELTTLAEGEIMNSGTAEGSNNTLTNGTKDNIRWEIQGANTDNGTFSLIVRRGDDSSKQKNPLETFQGLSLDPKAPNYISKVIGDTSYTVEQDGTDYYVKSNGTYINKSKYVRVSAVNAATPDYFDNNGVAKSAYTASIPVNGSGSFTGATGTLFDDQEALFNDAITSANVQGLSQLDYTQSVNLLSNKDEYRYNLLTVPGLNYTDHGTAVNLAVSTVESRQDAIAVIDLDGYNNTIGTITSAASAFDSSYAATYWPWLQTLNTTGQTVWVPASTMIPGVYAFTDASSDAWFAPAGLTRGSLGNVIKAERKLTSGNRDTLYAANVNPIATFPGSGVVVFGQKTLQKRASALDRVNVRRLLIELKNYISQISDNLVFEQNSIATRNSFLTQVNPYLEGIQQRQGLYAFKVVMDETNNTADVVDRNELVGQIYLQPTKTAEFILLDFNVLPTGATFPA
jgi:phage tail sheath protein FI